VQAAVDFLTHMASFDDAGVATQSIERTIPPTSDEKERPAECRPARNSLLFTALMFYTRLPAPTWIDHSDEQLNRATKYFPLMGGLWEPSLWDLLRGARPFPAIVGSMMA
jgi:hypothetical protein